jgi:valyl-tRNA synthetase
MRARYESWVSGLAGDWLISRQRFFGVPFPVWYPVGEDGSPVYSAPIVADEASLPVDPVAEPAPGYAESQRGVPGGFVGDPDIMDTWATSSLTPLIASRWGADDDLFGRVFPMDLRPQSHEIIRTWLFSTIVRSELEFGLLPWSDAAISGWILDPDRKKMSKSKGNVVTPADLLDQYGSDAVRYWAAGGRYGVDTAFDVGELKVGRRLAIKILNASKFVLSLDGAAGPVTEAVDRSLLAVLDGVVRTATAALDGYDHTGALEAVERFFWMFCDDYLELVKARAYEASGPVGASARGALRAALSVLLRLFAPFLPFVTEEAWSWWQSGSVHAAGWPSGQAELAGPAQAGAEAGNPAVLATAAIILGQIRRAKSEAKVSMRAEAERVVVHAPDAELALASADDLRAAGNIADLAVVPAPGGEPETEVTLAAPAA